MASYSGIFKSLTYANIVRKKMADYLLYMWLDFIFWHEYFHIMLGHCDYVLSNELYELPEKPLNEHELNIKRTLEAESDAFAARLSFGRLHIYKSSLDSSIGEVYKPEELYYDYALSIFFLFGFFEALKTPEDKREHPLPAERSIIFLSFIPEMGKHIQLTVTEDELLSYLVTAFFEYEKFMGREKGIEKRALDSQAFFNIADAYLKEINKTRKAIWKP